MRLRLPAFTFFILSLLLLWYVKPFSCTSVVFTWCAFVATGFSSRAGLPATVTALAVAMQALG